ncbi:hypothetical protein BC829DRAFT_303110 [Chytridium lagenaria]|nr:hypothetical protein BC829DRAFT_303110 [Chytridium lagenaria]
MELLHSIRQVTSSGLLAASEVSDQRRWLQILQIDCTSLEEFLLDGENASDNLQACVSECISICEDLSADEDRNTKLKSFAYITLGRLLLLMDDVESGISVYKKGIGCMSRCVEELGYVFELFSYLDSALLCYKTGQELSSKVERSAYIIRSACAHLQKNDMDAVSNMLSTLMDEERRQAAAKFMQLSLNLRRGGSSLKKCPKMIEDIRILENNLIAESLLEWADAQINK